MFEKKSSAEEGEFVWTGASRLPLIQKKGRRLPTLF